MGYSCTAIARIVLDVLQEQFQNQNSANTFTTDGGKTVLFWEIGREQPDGAVTGSVYRFLEVEGSKGYARRAGTFRINAEGTIQRFPRIPRSKWADIEKTAQARFDERYGAHLRA